METELKNAVGKSTGEVLRDLAEFLVMPFPVRHRGQEIDLCHLLPDLNMHGQLTFALMSEALTQGWDTARAEGFVRNALSSAADRQGTDAILAAFRDQNGENYTAYKQKYGNTFSMSGNGYWSTVLAVGIDADSIPSVMQYLRAFVVALLEFAYMGGANPKETYAWGYYESFHRILDELMKKPDPAPLPLKVRSIGGTSGKREGDAYELSLGVDVENPNSNRMARDVEIDVTLKDRNGEIITVLRDRIRSIDPATVYHFGITGRVHGAAVASLSAKARAASYLSLQTPIMHHARLENVRLKSTADRVTLTANLIGKYDTSLSSFGISCQLLTADNKILGGITDWCFEGLEPHSSRSVSITIPTPIKNAAKLVYSLDFDALELIK